MIIKLKDLQLVGENISATITTDNKLVFVVDLNSDLGTTASGGSLSLASSGGFKSLPLSEGLRYTLWVGRKLHKTIGKSMKRVDDRPDSVKMLD